MYNAGKEIASQLLGRHKIENWKIVIERVEKWQHTKRIPGTSMQEDKDIFIKELNNNYILIKRDDVEKNQIVFKPGAKPPEGIIL